MFAKPIRKRLDEGQGFFVGSAEEALEKISAASAVEAVLRILAAFRAKGLTRRKDRNFLISQMDRCTVQTQSAPNLMKSEALVYALHKKPSPFRIPAR